MALRDPRVGAVLVALGHVDRALARAHAEHRIVFADRLGGEGDLAFRAPLELFEERVVDRRRPEAGGAVMIEKHVARLQRQKALFPFVGNWAFLGQQRPRAELERHRPQFRIVDPVLPVAQVPHPAGHEDGGVVQAETVHQFAQRAHPRHRRFRLFRILAVRQAVMAAGQPRVFVDHAAQPFRELVIGAFPQGAERARRRNDRVIIDPVTGGNLGDPVGHAGAARDPVHQPLGAFQNAFQHFLRAAHFPQHVDVDAAVAIGHVVRDARLGNAALDRVFDQFAVAFAPRVAAVDHRDIVAVVVQQLRVDAGKGAGAAGRRPGAGAFTVRHGDALAALDQRQHLAARQPDGIKWLH